MVNSVLILSHDADLLVLNKPPGLSLLADRSGEACLWDELSRVCAEAKWGKPLQVHRLDKGTSGVLLVALSRRAQQSLTRQFSERAISKTYLAVTACAPDPPRGVIDLPLRPGRKGRYRVAGQREDIVCAPRPGGGGFWRLARGDGSDKRDFPAQTGYRVLSTDPETGRALLMLRPHTGRTHQLRVHLSWIGAPICGDSLYGKPDAPEQSADRLMLHCWKMVWRAEWSVPERFSCGKAMRPF
ncbi:MAG: RluA family pseudouridine synthase [Sumerlaeia bacterium]